MNILIISDIHGAVDKVKLLREEAEAADLVIAAGDITHFGSVGDAAAVLDRLREYNPQVKAIAGNCDDPEIEAYLEEEELLLDQEGCRIEGLTFLGLSGALSGPVSTPYEITEETIAARLASIPPAGENCTILISHQPPQRTIADRAMKVKHVGSRSVREWIEKNRPTLVVCGHIHESFGSQQLGPSMVLNPGALKDGRYATVEILPEDCKVTVELKRLG